MLTALKGFFCLEVIEKKLNIVFHFVSKADMIKYKYN